MAGSDCLFGEPDGTEEQAEVILDYALEHGLYSCGSQASVRYWDFKVLWPDQYDSYWSWRAGATGAEEFYLLSRHGFHDPLKDPNDGRGSYRRFPRPRGGWHRTLTPPRKADAFRRAVARRGGDVATLPLFGTASGVYLDRGPYLPSMDEAASWFISRSADGSISRDTLAGIDRFLVTLYAAMVTTDYGAQTGRSVGESIRGVLGADEEEAEYEMRDKLIESGSILLRFFEELGAPPSAIDEGMEEFADTSRRAIRAYEGVSEAAWREAMLALGVA